jgi:CRISPR-associated endonuclease/helicase Cas3
MAAYIARTRKNDAQQQPLIDHLRQTAERARKHAASWGGAFVHACGLTHDIGKYSDAFQARVRGATRRVDHATAGGQLLYELNPSLLGLFAAYCVMGHHGGLPNGGSKGQDSGDDTTLYGRLKRGVEKYGGYQKELTPPSLAPFPQQWKDGFDGAFFIRMAFSALVDADWLDTEQFCDFENAPRGGFSTLSSLCERLAARTERFLNPTGEISNLNQIRNQLLKNCLAAASSPAALFTLTAPTGSGKTIASLAFALKHALQNKKRRVIYIVPYNTIIEQNSAVFEDLLGAENVLRHYGDTAYDEEKEEDEVSQNKLRSTENWDYPLIVTSSVQFFESLFARKPSKCRKLHNIAESVLIFDEAQMIPVPYLLPCVRAIDTLATQYGCTAVLATATQSSLGRFFTKKPTEITENPNAMSFALRRAKIKKMADPLTDDELAEALLAKEQVLCIVNTRRHAQTLFGRLYQAMPEGAYHLSTTMIPAHRMRVLASVRKRLENKLPCRVVSTSLVEAGVDLDFETVYREQAGLDSIVQAAGRCNREGKRTSEASVVYVFTSAEHKPPRMIHPNIDAYRQVARQYDDLAGLDAIRAYFEQLLYNLGDERLDAKRIVPMFNENARAASFPFADVAQAFKLIDDSAQQTVYVLHEARELEDRLRAGERSRELFRALGAYGVSLYDQDVQALAALGAIERLDESVLLLFEKYYGEKMGVDLSPEGGQPLYS